MDTETLTIAAGETQSDVAKLLQHLRPVALIMPAAMTSDSLIIETQHGEGGDRLPIYDDGADYSVAVAASRWVPLKIANVAGLSRIAVTASEAEAADREITVVLRSV